MEYMFLLHQSRAGMVYCTGLRRCLIIFAPQALILDRRTCTCKAPSLQLIMQRSKNFTSGAAVSFTLNTSIISAWKHTTWMGPSPRARTTTRGHAPDCSDLAPRPAQLIAKSDRCCAIHWMACKPLQGCLKHTEFTRVALMLYSGYGQILRGTGPHLESQASVDCKIALAFTEEDFMQEPFSIFAVGIRNILMEVVPSRQRVNAASQPSTRPESLWQTTSVLTAAMLVYTNGAGITAAAGTRLALHLLLMAVFG